jgi:TPR repeat protein
VKAPEEVPPPADGVDPGNAATKPGAAPPQNQGVDATDAAESPVPKETPAAPVVPAAPVRKPAVAKPSPTIPTVSPEDRLVDEGEKYLYGRGVRADCALAQRNLMIGARQSNPKAQTLLGAMYATGHCVGRDLPIAYRWFAKALHGDPGNSRVQRDLEVLWKQMTPEERQLAMKSQ